MRTAIKLLVGVGMLCAVANAQSSCTALQPSGSVRPSVASGYQLQVVATGLSTPRGIQFDSAGNLLVINSGQGSGSLIALQLAENNGCVVAGQPVTVVSNQSVCEVRGCGK